MRSYVVCSISFSFSFCGKMSFRLPRAFASRIDVFKQWRLKWRLKQARYPDELKEKIIHRGTTIGTLYGVGFGAFITDNWDARVLAVGAYGLVGFFGGFITGYATSLCLRYPKPIFVIVGLGSATIVAGTQAGKMYRAHKKGIK